MREYDVIRESPPFFFSFFFLKLDGTTCFYREGNSMCALEMEIFAEGRISIDFQWLRGSKLNRKSRIG